MRKSLVLLAFLFIGCYNTTTKNKRDCLEACETIENNVDSVVRSHSFTNYGWGCTCIQEEK